MQDPEFVALKNLISELQRAHHEIQKRLERSASDQRRLEERVRLVEDTPSFRFMRAVGRLLATQKRRLGQVLLRSPLRTYSSRLLSPVPGPDQYGAWMEEQRLSAASPECCRSTSKAWRIQPCVSIVMPIHNPRREWLQHAIDSVLAQSYENWQLCVCHDAASEAWVHDYMCLLARKDKRIRHVAASPWVGISGALNQAGSLASGDYIGFLDPNDALADRAIYAIVETLQTGPADIVYSDEDHLDPNGDRARPRFKPGWSPELLLTCMYLGHFLVVSRAGLEQAGWFRSTCDGAEDYDLVLRMTDANAEVRHVPEVLYHARQLPVVSEASRTSAARAAVESLSEAVRRRGWKGQAGQGELPGTYCLRREIDRYPSVSVIVCSRNSELLQACLESLRRNTNYPNWEIVIVMHTFGCDRNLAQVVSASKCASVAYSGQFNFSRMNNLGAAAARGDLLIFLNDDVEAIQPDWMTYMTAQLMRPDAGAVGACLLYPSGMLQHAGVVVPMSDGAGHAGRGSPPNSSEFWPWLSFTRNVTAVTGACLGIRRAVFERLGGMDTAFPNNYNDVDLCLRADREGFMTIYESRALLRHKECATRVPGTTFDERELFHARWGHLLGSPDPYYNPSLRTDTEAVMLRFPVATPAVSAAGKSAEPMS
jgi:GT2 family glycosyltransferase